jgi:hypothetical protein
MYCAMGESEKLCMDVISSENTNSAVALRRAVKFCTRISSAAGAAGA